MPSKASIRTSPWRALFTLVKLLKFEVAARFLTSYPITHARWAPPVPSEVPPRWFGWLKKKRWFRRLLLSSYEPPVSSREIPMTYGPVVPGWVRGWRKRTGTVRDMGSCLDTVLKNWHREMNLVVAERWRGMPRIEIADPKFKRPSGKSWGKIRLGRRKTRAKEAWARPVLEAFNRYFPIFSEWLEDNSGLGEREFYVLGHNRGWIPPGHWVVGSATGVPGILMGNRRWGDVSCATWKGISSRLSERKRWL